MMNRDMKISATEVLTEKETEVLNKVTSVLNERIGEFLDDFIYAVVKEEDTAGVLADVEIKYGAIDLLININKDRIDEILKEKNDSISQELNYFM